MFDSKHYVPILKWKRAEYKALEALGDQSKKYITPLLELVMPTVPLHKDKERKIKKTPEEIFKEVVSKFKEKRIGEISEEILNSWGTRPIFVDFSLLYEAEHTTRLKVESLKKVVSAGTNKGLHIIPVLNLNDDRKIKKIVCQLSSEGICLRILASDLLDVSKLNTKIDALLSDFSLNKKNIDLLIDIKTISENGGQYLQLTNLSQMVTGLSEWRNFIFASGAFPEDLTECKLDEPTFLPRFDWQNWLHHTKAKKLRRNPTFADYTIRNPIFIEALQYFNNTTSIKYTIENDWLILKGEVRKFGLYLVNAKLLVEDSEYFYGETFSAGDQYIAQKAKHYHDYIKNSSIKGTGRSEDWIAMGINHHLMLVIHQIANLA